MSNDQNPVRTQARERTQRKLETHDIGAQVAKLLPGVTHDASDPVSMTIPPYRVRQDEASWQCFLSDATFMAKRRGLLAHIRALLDLDARAKREGLSLAEAARQQAEKYRRCLEVAWVSLLEQNRAKEEAIRYCALFFSNLQDSITDLRGKIFAIDATGEEIASDTGREILADELSKYVDRPDPRQSRAYLIVQGWVGTPVALDRLGRVTHAHRALLVSDGPAYDSMEKLETAAADGGLLECLVGEEVHHRHAVLVANNGRARRRFQGRFAAEKSDVLVPMSGPWFGGYLDNIARGLPWKPKVGYRNPVAGIDGVQLDLRLSQKNGYSLYLRHRLNPCILQSAGSERVVIWGPDALSKVGNGVQIGVAVVEMIIVRYAEWIVNQYGLLDDLEEAQQVVKTKLSQFMVENSGVGRMFRAGSRVQVSVDHEIRSLMIDFELLFREIAERATIRLNKPLKRDELAAVKAASN